MKKLTQEDFIGLGVEWIYLGIDSQGTAYKFRKKPEVADDGYYEKSWSYFGDGYDATDWQNSLIKREVGQ